MPGARNIVSLDVRGEICPSPMIAAAEAMQAAKEDEAVEVITDHRPALLTVPAQAIRLGWDVQLVQTGRSEWRITLTRSAFPLEDEQAE